jgi:hypothetical protein
MIQTLLAAAAAAALCLSPGPAPPVETAPANGAAQSPAFPGQTRAPEAKSGVAPGPSPSFRTGGCW